ncbi:MAG: phytanoyl-CoA dioxygenase family protein [Fibrella sp.]|nr:phytanoyl-CoA dioxygenase family protein [Armatimonadota bacterium]
MMTTTLTDDQWAQYERDGYVRLGKLLSDEDLKALQDRINAIMLGTANLDYDSLLMQLDSEDGKYENAGRQSKGFKGARLDYRKIQDLEYDPLFREFMERPIFKHICAHVYGENHPVETFRAMFMNKPAQRGTFLPWHQDRWTYLDRDPKITLWTALDPATKANGCVQVVPGSHTQGMINPSHLSGFLTEAQAAEHAPPEKVVFLELEPGEVALLHNYLLHASDVNHMDISRRAFSVCYMDGDTVNTTGEKFTRLW